MATAIKTCRVCGKEYEACHTASQVKGVFRWREVACSPECGAIYLQRIRESRSGSVLDGHQENEIEAATPAPYHIDDPDIPEDDEEDLDEDQSLDDEDEYDGE